MADLVYMTKSAWKSLLDAIRTKAGKTDALTVSQAQKAVEGIEAAGKKLEIVDASYLFYKGTKISEAKELCALLSPSITDLSYMFVMQSTKASELNLSASDDALANIDYSKVKTMDSFISIENAAGKFGAEQLTATLLRALSATYIDLVYARNAFSISIPSNLPNNKLSITMTIASKSWNGYNAESLFSGLNGTSTTTRIAVDFTGSDFSSVYKAKYAFANGLSKCIVTFPEMFFKNVGDLYGLFQGSSLRTEARNIIKLPTGFAKTAHEGYGSSAVNLGYMFATTDAEAIDINSDFLETVYKTSNYAYVVDENPTITDYGLINYNANIKSLIIRCSRMIPYNTMFKDGLTPKIFVPSSMVDTYKAATNWSARADYIFAVEDYTRDGTIDGDFDYDRAGISLS